MRRPARRWKGALVVVSHREVERAEREVARLVRDATTPYRAQDLIEQVTSQGIAEDLVRYAIWALIDKNHIRLTTERLLAPTG